MRIKVNNLIILYLSLFLVSCGPRQLSFDEARNIQTHMVSVGQQTAINAVVTALQDQLYLIDNVDDKFGIIMASRITQKKLADTVKEPDKSEIPLWLKITGIAFIITIIGIIIYSFSDSHEEDSECNDDENHDHHHHYNHINYNENLTYKYSLNISIVSTNSLNTQIRIVAQGETLSDGNVISAGSIQDRQFFKRIFDQIDSVIFK